MQVISVAFKHKLFLWMKFVPERMLQFILTHMCAEKFVTLFEKYYANNVPRIKYAIFDHESHHLLII